MSDYLDDLQKDSFPVMNLQRVLESQDVPEFLKEITRRVLASKSGHYSFGEWVQSASWVDIYCLGKLCNVIQEGADQEVPSEDLESLMGAMAVLTTKIFAMGEGLSSMTRDEEGVLTRVSLMQSYISAEKLKRAGLPVKIHYSSMSLDEELSDVEDMVVIEMFPDLKPPEEPTA